MILSITTPNITTYNSGSTVTVTAPATAVVGGVTYKFVSWENGSNNLFRNFTITANTVITATYVPVYTLTVV
jgi:hypothetical protein